MKGYPTSYTGMFEASADDEPPTITRVEIPLIQRDYAQGRRSAKVNEIRDTFVEALHDALTTGRQIGLDFVYGELKGEKGETFEPLDGQQRLTTLFLLHWYLAYRTGRLDGVPSWGAFTYATRPSARLFCERIIENPPPTDYDGVPSTWIKDQPWYLHLWRFDPTIEAMLVTLDTINARFRHDDLDPAWSRLTDTDVPAIWFQLLPIDKKISAEDLYIKMNSRGKPLTDFENFKAHLGEIISHTGRAQEFGQKVDGRWADLLWPYRGDNDLIDDEFMKYLDFVLEICEWREGRVRDGKAPLVRPERRASTLFGEQNERHDEHLDFFFRAFDAWWDDDAPTAAPGLAAIFGGFFTVEDGGTGIRLFGAPDINLFVTCCERYGEMRGNTRVFSLTDTLLLYATLVHRVYETDDAARRLRVIRNANEASLFELRLQNMPKLVAEVEAFMRTGSLDALETYNTNQVVDEEIKRSFLEQHPELEPSLHLWEDQSILRGTLAAFDLDSETIDGRARAFGEVFRPENWQLLTGALLAVGEYQHDSPKWDFHQFGSPTTESVWRTVLVGRGDRENLERTGHVVSNLLDAFAKSDVPVDTFLHQTVDGLVADRLSRGELDWRYYLVRYPRMREGNSGIYYGAGGTLSYEMTMLRKTVQRSWYRDPYLYAIWREAGSPKQVPDPWFFGYSSNPRWMRLERSGAGLRSVQPGIALDEPVDERDGANFESICEQRPDVIRKDDGWLLVIAQRDNDGVLIDTEDRVQRGAALLKELIASGL